MVAAMTHPPRPNQTPVLPQAEHVGQEPAHYAAAVADPKATLGTKLAAAKWAVAGYAVLVAALVGAWFLVVPSRPPRFSHPSVWDVLADSRVVVGAQRLVGPVVGVYVILSVVALTVEGRWLDGLGPLRAGKVSRASRAASRKVPVLLANIESLQKTNKMLEDRLAASDELLQRMAEGADAPER